MLGDDEQVYSEELEAIRIDRRLASTEPLDCLLADKVSHLAELLASLQLYGEDIDAQAQAELARLTAQVQEQLRDACAQAFQPPDPPHIRLAGQD